MCNEDELNNVDDFDEISAEDMERDAAFEMELMCQAAEAEEAYFKKEKEDAERAKRNRAKWGL